MNSGGLQAKSSSWLGPNNGNVSGGESDVGNTDRRSKSHNKSEEKNSIDLDSSTINKTDIGKVDDMKGSSENIQDISDPATTADSKQNHTNSGKADNADADNITGSVGVNGETQVVVAADPNHHPLDEGGCFVCKKNNQQDLILLCDGCDGEYHTYCVKPPLRRIPDDEWFCTACKAKGKGAPKPHPLSRYTGVYWAGTVKGRVRNILWTAKIRRRAGRGEATIGSYTSEREAAGAFDAEAVRVFGDAHPPLNFPNGQWDDEPDEPTEPEMSEEADKPERGADDTTDRPEVTPDPPAFDVKLTTSVSLPSPGTVIGSIGGRDSDGWVDVSAAGGRGTSTTGKGTTSSASTSTPDARANGATVGSSQAGDVGGSGIGRKDGDGSNGSDGSGTLACGAASVFSPHTDTGITPRDQERSSESASACNGVEEARESKARAIVTGFHSKGKDRNDKLRGVQESTDAPGTLSSSSSPPSAPSPAVTSTPASGGGGDGGDGVVGDGDDAASSADDGRPSAPLIRPSLSINILNGGEDIATGDSTPSSPKGRESSVGSETHVSVSGGNSGGVGGVSGTSGGVSGERGGSRPASAASPDGTSMGGRKRTKAKWLQQYEDDDDDDVRGNASSSNAKKRTSDARGKQQQQQQQQNVGGGTPTPISPAPNMVAGAERLSGDGDEATHVAPTKHSKGAGAGIGGTSSPRGGKKGGDSGSGKIQSEEREKRDGKGTGKEKVSKKTPWGRKDWAGTAFSKTALRQIKETVSMWATSEDGTLVGEDGNHFFCSVCGEHGELTCCDFCPRVFHEECLVLGSDSQLAAEHQTDDDPWHCPSCVHAGQVNLVAGKKPSWTVEQRGLDSNKPEPVQESIKASGKTKSKPSSAKASKNSKRKSGQMSSASTVDPLPSPPSQPPAESSKHSNPSTGGQTGGGTAAATAAAAAEAAATASHSAVNVNDAADPAARHVTRVRVFSPELDNLLLRSLLYDEKYHYVLPKTAQCKKPRLGRAQPSCHSRTESMGPGDGVTTETFRGEARLNAQDGRAGIPPTTHEATPLGAPIAHPKMSAGAGKRPKHQACRDGTRLGPPFGASSGASGGPSGILDGTAVSFGARAMGPFRAGMAATMVDVGLVPEGVAADAGYRQLVDSEAALSRGSRKTFPGDIGAMVSAKDKAYGQFGSASTRWRSRALTAHKMAINRPPQSMHSPLDGGRSRSASSGRQPMNAEQGRRNSAGGDGRGGISNGLGRNVSRSESSDRSSSERREMYIGGSRLVAGVDGGSGTGSGRESPRGYGRMDDYMDEERNGESYGGRGGTDTGRAGPTHIRRIPSGSRIAGAGLGPPGRPRQERDGGRQGFKAGRSSGSGGRVGGKDPETKKNRLWNLKHMRATRGEGGKMDVCSYCRLYPDGALMVCASQELSRTHAFCFPCLATKEGIEKQSLTSGSVKWECPTCRERRDRPQRRSQPPSSLRGAAWAGGGVLTSPGALTHGGGAQHHAAAAAGASGFSRDVGRGGAAGGAGGAGGRGLKRTLSSADLTDNPRERGGRKSPLASFSTSGYPSFPSSDGAAGSHAFRRDASPRAGDGKSGGGGGSGGGSVGGNSVGDSSTIGGADGGSGGWHAGEGPAPPAKLSIEQRRLLRLVTTLALDRLQRLDPLDLFKDPVPAGVTGYAEAIPFPIDFSTVRRRSQWEVYGSIRDVALDVELLCANARAFNGPGTVYHSAATTVLEGAERLWPQVQELLESLALAETKAASHCLTGPAASSDAWPLDGHFAGFDLTPANEDAYYMHIAIRRAAAAYRVREEEGELQAQDAPAGKRDESEEVEENFRAVGGMKRGSGGWVRGRQQQQQQQHQSNGSMVGGVISAACAAAGNISKGVERGREEDRVKALSDAAAFAASSPTLLYTRGRMGDEESLLRDTLAAFKADRKEEALRRSNDCAKCEPIDPALLLARKNCARPLPTPVTRQEVAPDGEFLELDPASGQPGPVGPNPKLEGGERATVAEGTAVSTSRVPVAPEWRVLQAAHGAKQRSGEEAAKLMRTFRKFFKDVDACAGKRLWVGKSAVQGLGVFTAEAIQPHELVAEYVGERIKLSEAERRTEAYRKGKIADYIVRLDDKTFLDATRKGNISRFFNHSCAPNCYMKTVVAGKGNLEEKRVCFFSLRDIRMGEEVSYAYPAPHKVGLGAVVARECTCRAPGCRGRMSTREQF